MAQQINLYNPIFLKQKKYFSAATMVQALALVAVGTLAVYGYAVHQAGTLARLSAETNRQVVQQREQMLKLAAELSPQGRNRPLQDEMARLTAQIDQRRALLDSLRSGALGNTEGFSEYLAAFARQVLPGVWLVGLRLGGAPDELVVRGRVLRADLIPPYIRALSNEAVMRGRSVTDLKLTAHEAPPRKSAADPAKAERDARRTPENYVEFDLSAPRQPPETMRPQALPGDATGRQKS